MTLFAPPEVRVDVIQFTVPGEPEGSQRAGRTVRRNRFGKAYVQTYTTPEARAYTDLLVLYARSHMPREPWTGPIRVDIDVFVDRPERLLKKSSPRGPIWCTAKPDRDNVEKAVLDALTKAGLWLDDKQVCDGPVRKFYVAIGHQPGMVITARRLSTEPTQLELQGQTS